MTLYFKVIPHGLTERIKEYDFMWEERAHGNLNVLHLDILKEFCTVTKDMICER